MGSELVFYFRIASDAGYAVDEFGEYADCYVKMSLTFEHVKTEEELRETYEQAKETMRLALASDMGLDEHMLELITYQEYCENMEED